LSLTQQLLLNLRGGMVSLRRALGLQEAFGLAHGQALAPLPAGVQARVQAELQQWQHFAGPTRAWAYCFCSLQ
jgi:hypothetical protein